MDCIHECGKIPGIRLALDLLDCEVRLDDAVSLEVIGNLRQHGAEMKQIFHECSTVRFPAENSTILEAFVVFDPLEFPNLREVPSTQKETTLKMYTANPDRSAPPSL